MFSNAPERSVVVVIYGPSRSNPFKSMAGVIAAECSRRGLQCFAMDLWESPWPNPEFDALYHGNKIRYGVAWGGIGAAIEVPTGDKQRNVWDAGKTPLFKLMGDHPAYFLDLHISPYSTFVNTYGFSEHRDFFLRHMDVKGYGAIVPLVAIDALEPAQLDFEAKKKGKIFFLKNGNDPEALRQAWRDRLPPQVAESLLAMGEELLASLPHERSWEIENLVVRHFAELGIDIADRLKFLSFHIAQLDDFLRRVKSNMIAESLLDFPIEIHGECWDHLDFSGRRAQLVPFGDYTRSKQLISEALCVLDMSPNTHSRPHERFLRCASRHTLCLTNQNDFLAQQFGPFGQPLFDFTPDSIRESVSRVIADPAGHVEIGRQVGAEFTRLYPEGGLLDFFEMMTAQIRVQEGEDPLIQNFFSWPPKWV